MLKEGINGFCMALADSVPGVSGGTVAFIMGFYDKFIGAVHNIAFVLFQFLVRTIPRPVIWQNWASAGRRE